MDYRFFQKIFEHLAESKWVDQLLGLAEKRLTIKKIDSTIVTLAAKLIELGLKVNPKTRDLKFSLGLVEGLPVNLELLTRQTFASEDKALPTIMAQNKDNDQKLNILLFDRGVHKKDTYDWID